MVLVPMAVAVGVAIAVPVAVVVGGASLVGEGSQVNGLDGSHLRSVGQVAGGQDDGFGERSVISVSISMPVSVSVGVGAVGGLGHSGQVSALGVGDLRGVGEVAGRQDYRQGQGSVVTSVVSSVSGTVVRPMARVAVGGVAVVPVVGAGPAIGAVVGTSAGSGQEGNQDNLKTKQKYCRKKMNVKIILNN